MFISLYFASILLALAYCIHSIRCHLKNLSDARKTGLLVVQVPIRTLNVLWLFFHYRWAVPLLRLLPAKLTFPWLDLIDPEWMVKQNHRLFDKLGTETFITCSPGGCLVWTCNPEVTTQILLRPRDFVKPPGLAAAVGIYGDNILGAEGLKWRRFRRTIAPKFNDSTFRLVWKETLQKSQELCALWYQAQHHRGKKALLLTQDLKQLSLQIISKTGFGVDLSWQSSDSGEADAILRDCSSSFRQALLGVLEHLFVIALLPHWFLRYSPFKTLRSSLVFYQDWYRYLKNMLEIKRRAILEGYESEKCDFDLMAALVQEGTSKSKPSIQESDKRLESDQEASIEALSDEDILGNTFILLFAGHETTANAIHFSILYLALNPSLQRRLQKDLDDILGDRPTAEWSYDQDLPKFGRSMVAAVLHEELRLIPPLQYLLKNIKTPQTMQVDGQSRVLPANAKVLIVTTAAQRSRKTWPVDTSIPEELQYEDLDAFRPERWLRNPDAQGMHKDGEIDNGINTFSKPLLQPKPATYFPFSQGLRSCVGKRFAEIEAMTALAVIFKSHSVELDLSDRISSAEFTDLSTEARTRIWQEVARDALKDLQDLVQRITLQLRAGSLPVRIVKRGREMELRVQGT